MKSTLGRRARLVVWVLTMALMAVGTAAADSLQAIREGYAQGDLAGALSALESHLRDSPDDAEALFLRGAVLTDLGRGGEAAKAFERVVQLDPGLPEAYNNLAVLYASDGQYQRAIDVLKSALGTDPAYHAAFDNLSRLYARLASDAYSRALGVEARHEQEMPLVLLRQLGRRGAAASEPAAATPLEPLEPRVAAEPPPPVTVPRPTASGAEDETEPSPPLAASLEPPLADGAQVADMSDSVAEASGDASWEAAADAAAELALAVQSWAEAWSDQDVDRYLAAYASDFRPSNGLSRAAWERERRQRVAAPQRLEVSVAFIEAGLDGPTTGSIRFLQSYKSDRFSDQVTKVLRMVLEEGAWKIVEERVETP